MKLISHSVKDTLRLGRLLGVRLKPADILCLFGGLGSGKTVFTKGIALGMGIPKEKIISPSFVLIREHQGRNMPLYHFDLYRLRKEQDILNLGYEGYFYGEGVTVIEWADRLKKIAPEKSLKIYFSHLNSCSRLLEFSASGARYAKLLKEFYEDIGD
ncbi:MAG: tRNA (adenosine(37)-N6)-threonylcarbamoyltransferase complex ATPase subunit type 1 TsaE [Candidatus Omnitrophica bacterium]|nr:tRNA (adenosine(37)-N6)-threonylcarbamoyltransferase complex ATPase subunit type 1 TsaE [Candidatus Omnitrophota bacterium]